MLKSSWRKRLSKESFPKAAERAAALPTAELFNATDAHLYYVGQSLQQWRKGYGEAAMEEAEKNILALLEICRELATREQGGQFARPTSLQLGG